MRVNGQSAAASNEHSEPIMTSVEEVNRRPELFIDPARPPEHNIGDRQGRFVVVEDDFYNLNDPINPEDAGEIRRLFLRQPFYQYSPPLRTDFDPHTYDNILEDFPQYRNGTESLGTWRATARKVFAEYDCKEPIRGFQYNPETLRQRVSKLLGETILPDSWNWGGGWWNGAGHLIDADYTGSSIHHHCARGDVAPRGWSGLVYLSPHAPPWSGTSIVLDTDIGRCVGPYNKAFGYDWSHCHRLLQVENKYNRLVLFRENILHIAERGFGHGQDARLTQTFFFRTVRL